MRASGPAGSSSVAALTAPSKTQGRFHASRADLVPGARSFPSALARRQAGGRLGVQGAERVAYPAEALDRRWHGLASPGGQLRPFLLHRADSLHRRGDRRPLSHCAQRPFHRLARRPGLGCGPAIAAALLDRRDRAGHAARPLRRWLAAGASRWRLFSIHPAVRPVGQRDGDAGLDCHRRAARRGGWPGAWSGRLSMVACRTNPDAGSRSDADRSGLCLSGPDSVPVRLRPLRPPWWRR